MDVPAEAEQPQDGPDRAPARHPSSQAGRRGRPKWLLLASIGVGIASLGTLFAYGLSRDPEARSPANIGKPAPAFTATTLDGTTTISLAGLRGQVVVLNFWASWCVDCRVEQPALARLWERYRDHGVVIVGMTFEDAVSASKAYAAEFGTGWPLVTDPGSKTAIAYGVAGVPETFLIGADGTIAGKTTGPVSYDVLSGEISNLLGASGG